MKILHSKAGTRVEWAFWRPVKQTNTEKGTTLLWECLICFCFFPTIFLLDRLDWTTDTKRNSTEQTFYTKLNSNNLDWTGFKKKKKKCSKTRRPLKRQVLLFFLSAFFKLNISKYKFRWVRKALWTVQGLARGYKVLEKCLEKPHDTPFNKWKVTFLSVWNWLGRFTDFIKTSRGRTKKTKQNKRKHKHTI